MSRVNRTVPHDDHVLDVLLRDLVGHDKHPAAFIVYLHLYGLAARRHWTPPVAGSLRDIAEATGLSKSAVQTALYVLRRRELVMTEQTNRTAAPTHRVLRHWLARKG